MTSHLLLGSVPIELTALPSVLKGKDISRGSRLLAEVATFREVTNSSGRALRDVGRSREIGRVNKGQGGRMDRTLWELLWISQKDDRNGGQMGMR